MSLVRQAERRSWPAGITGVVLGLAHAYTFLPVGPRRHILCTALLAFYDLALLLKVLEVAFDLVWVRRTAPRYTALAARFLRRSGRIDLDRLDLHLAHAPASWRFAHTHVWLRPLVDTAFRIPVLLACLWLTLLPLAFYPTSSPAAFYLYLTAGMALLGIALSTASAIVQRLYYDWFDYYKREWRRYPTAPYVLRMVDVGAPRALRLQISYIISLYYVTIAGYSAIYFALYNINSNCFSGLTAYHIPVVLQLTYFSAVTMATVGYGDIFPACSLTMAMTTLQILFGPILLTLVLLALGSRTEPLNHKE